MKFRIASRVYKEEKVALVLRTLGQAEDNPMATLVALGSAHREHLPLLPSMPCLHQHFSARIRLQ